MQHLMQIENVNLVAEHANADHEQVKGSFTSYVLTTHRRLQKESTESAGSSINAKKAKVSSSIIRNM